MASLFKRFAAGNNDPWKELAAHKTHWIQNQVVLVEETKSLWYSTDGGYGENGMVEFDYTTNKIKQVVKYPQNIKPVDHSCCGIDEKIYMVKEEKLSYSIHQPENLRKK